MNLKLQHIAFAVLFLFSLQLIVESFSSDINGELYYELAGDFEEDKSEEDVELEQEKEKILQDFFDYNQLKTGVCGSINLWEIKDHLSQWYMEVPSPPPDRS